MPTPIEQFVERLRRAPRVTVLTGAGVSAASGVPTFRGTGGLWRNFSAIELASADGFARDPATVWEWYDWRRCQIAACVPNPAHEVLARWTKTAPGWRVITQNVDDLHQRAGTRDLVRLHGSIWELTCWNRCGHGPGRWRDERAPLPERPPRCPGCGGLARPGVVWFGESLDPVDVRTAEALTSCDIFVAAGTSAMVYPAAGFLHAARAKGAYTVELNVESTDATPSVDLAIRGPVETTLAAVDALLNRPARG